MKLFYLRIYTHLNRHTLTQDGAKWSGVSMGNLFSRPHATALFILDGLTDGKLLDITNLIRV